MANENVVLKPKNLENDPEYEEIHFNSREQQLEVLKQDAKEATVRKIQDVINTNFMEEIKHKEHELDTIQKNLIEAKCMMDHLRACIITKFFAQDFLKGNENVDNCDWVHPNSKQFVGKAPCWSDIKADHDYHILAHEPLDRTPSDKLEKNKFVKSFQGPSVQKNVPLTFRTSVKIVVGNISKYILSEERSSSKDQATHKWMVYVRPQDSKIEASNLISRILVFLHPSYKPNDLVEISKPPFCLCRRGWGEFPIRVQIHFHDPRNKPVDVIHQLNLDKTFTGLQTLGGESLVEVLLYTSHNQSPIKSSVNTMEGNVLPDSPANGFESATAPVRTEQLCDIISKEDDTPMDVTVDDLIKQDNSNAQFVAESMDYISAEFSNQEVNNSRQFGVNNVEKIENFETSSSNYLKSPDIMSLDNILTEKIIGSRDSALENSDANHVQEASSQIPVLNAINFLPSTAPKKSLHSIIVPKPKSLLKNEANSEPVLLITSSTPIQITIKSDSSESANGSGQIVHYFKPNEFGECLVPISLLKPKSNKVPSTTRSEISWSQKERQCEEQLNLFISRLREKEYNSIHELMFQLIKVYPLVSSDPYFPFCALTELDFQSWNIGRQRACEWSRARCVHQAIKKILRSHKLSPSEQPWSVKDIVKWSRRHGYAIHIEDEGKSRSENIDSSLTSPDGLLDKLETEHLALNAVRKSSNVERDECDEPVDIETGSQNEEPTHRKRKITSRLDPCTSSTNEPEETNLCQVVLMQACKEFLTDVLHDALGESGCNKEEDGITTIRCSNVYSAIQNLSFCDFLTNKNLGIEQL